MWKGATVLVGRACSSAALVSGIHEMLVTVDLGPFGPKRSKAGRTQNMFGGGSDDDDGWAESLSSGGRRSRSCALAGGIKSMSFKKTWSVSALRKARLRNMLIG